MKLIRTSLFAGIITFIRISSGFIAGKVVAVLTGPSGVALLGQFINLINLATPLANGAINVGVVKFTAEYDDNETKLKLLFSTALKISICCSFLIGLALILGAEIISIQLLYNDIYVIPIRIFGCSVIFYALNSLLISILNGKKQIKTYTIVNTVGSLVGLLLTIILVYYFNLMGALYSLVLAQSITFFITSSMIIKSPWFTWSFFTQPFNSIIAKKLSGYALMAIVTLTLGPITHITIRNIIIQELGIPAAGLWQGMMRISDGYLMLVTVSLSTYYIPKLSSLKTDNELRNEIYAGYKTIIPIVFLGCITIYLFRYYIIRILFSPEFLEMETLFIYQLIGDLFKVSAWLIGYLMIAKAMIKTSIISEVVFNLIYIILSYTMTSYFGLKGVTVGYAINYSLYLILMIFIFRKLLFFRVIK